ncbi:MAG TPA: dsRBD fold-containing protein, partial [Actinoplanes sp.]|nr:dsRBD fold-containing protein [Actinoplanes sp.]
EARRRPTDTEVPEIGDELATARALADLAYKLLDVTVGDIEQFTHEPARLTS